MELFDKNFNEQVLESDKPVLVEFWASWCIPCKSMEFILQELEKEYDGAVKIAKLNIDRNRETAKKFDISGVPTFMSFKDGKIIESDIGAQSKEDLKQMIENILE